MVKLSSFQVKTDLGLFPFLPQVSNQCVPLFNGVIYSYW